MKTVRNIIRILTIGGLVVAVMGLVVFVIFGRGETKPPPMTFEKPPLMTFEEVAENLVEAYSLGDQSDVTGDRFRVSDMLLPPLSVTEFSFGYFLQFHEPLTRVATVSKRVEGTEGTLEIPIDVIFVYANQVIEEDLFQELKKNSRGPYMLELELSAPLYSGDFKQETRNFIFTLVSIKRVNDIEVN